MDTVINVAALLIIGCSVWGIRALWSWRKSEQKAEQLELRDWYEQWE